MMFKAKKKKDKQGVSLFKGIYTAYFILLFHVVMIGGIGLVIILFNGILSNIVPILIVCGLLFISFCYFLVRFIKRKGHMIKDVVASPHFSNRSVEVSLFGGMASIKIASPVQNPNGVQIEDTSMESGLLNGSGSGETKEFKKVQKIIGKKHVKPDEYDIIKSADGS